MGSMWFKRLKNGIDCKSRFNYSKVKEMQLVVSNTLGVINYK